MSDTTENKYTWRPWWAPQVSTVESGSPPQIATLLPALRARVGGLKAETKAGVNFKIKSAAALMGKLREGLDELGMSAWVAGQDVQVLEVERGTGAFVKALIRVGCPDGSFVDFVGCGHGVDAQDKAAGKASTYAWKDAFIKGLDLPDADMVDTDDSSEPIPGGVVRKAKAADPKAVEKRAAALGSCERLLEVDNLLDVWRKEYESGVITGADAAALSKLAKDRRAQFVTA